MSGIIFGVALGVVIGSVCIAINWLLGEILGHARSWIRQRKISDLKDQTPVSVKSCQEYGYVPEWARRER